MSNHKQANLYKATHVLVDEIAEAMNKNPLTTGKVSKAQVVHNSVLAMHKKVVKK